MLLIATGLNNLILTSPDGNVWTTVHAADGSGNYLGDIAWNGHNNYVIVGQSGIWSSTDGGASFVNRAVPAGYSFTLATLIASRGIFKLVIWDGLQFVVVGWFDTGGGALQGVVGTSPDGVTWSWANAADSFNPVAIAFNGSTYVLLDWRAFHGGGAQKSRFYSAATPLGAWTLRFTSATEVEYAWLGSNGSSFLAFSSQNAVAAYSADGSTWAENATAVKIPEERNQVLWDIISNQWIVSGQLANGNYGIATTPSGAAFTTRLDVGAAGFAATVLRGAGGNLFSWVGTAVTGPFTSVDNGTSWTSLVDPDDTDQTDAVWTNAQFVARRIPPIADNYIGTSPDFVTYTSRYDDADGQVDIIRVFGVGTPPAPSACVDFEIESPGDMPDSGQQFTGQRLLLTLNCNVSGVPQTLTPILIIDGVEHTLPQITTMKRETLDIPIYGYHGRFFDGVRLTGCLTGRVEVFRIEATVALGM